MMKNELLYDAKIFEEIPVFNSGTSEIIPYEITVKETPLVLNEDPLPIKMPLVVSESGPPVKLSPVVEANPPGVQVLPSAPAPVSTPAVTVQQMPDGGATVDIANQDPKKNNLLLIGGALVLAYLIFK